MNSDHFNQITEIVRRMRRLPSLSAARRHSVDRLEAMAWAHDLAALSRLWAASPELAEQYLDVMVSALHAFPGTVARKPAAPTLYN